MAHFNTPNMFIQRNTRSTPDDHLSTLSPDVRMITAGQYLSIIESGDMSAIESILNNDKLVIVEVSTDFDRETKGRAMRFAITTGNLDLVKTLMASDSDFYRDMVKWDGLIHHSVENSQPEIVRFLMETAPDLISIFGSFGVVESLNFIYSQSSLEQQDYSEGLRKNRSALETAIQKGDLDMVYTLIDSGWNINWNRGDLTTMFRKFGWEKSLRSLEAIIPDCDKIDYADLVIFILNSPEFEWIRDHGWPLPNNDYFISNISEHPILHVFQALLSKDPNGNRWWSHNYDRFHLIRFAECARNHVNPKIRSGNRQIIEVFISSVQNLEEQAVIDRLTIDFPEYEVLERSFAP